MRTLAFAAVALTFGVVVVGAYVRLSDAGLGCPDWPLCYGQPLPEDPGDARAWKEMAHRYLAGTLGLLILGIAFVAWNRRQSRVLATLIAALVVLQAALGMWTVTLLLQPAIVTAHLLGGMALLGLLVWLALSLGRYSSRNSRELRLPAALALIAVVIQIALGGWVSANYAGLACPDLPLCRGALIPPMDALTAAHWAHRVFALIALAVIGWAALRTLHLSRPLAVAIAALLLLQFSLGVANVALGLPLALAAAHNAGAAALLASLVVLNFFSFRGLRPSW